MQWLKRIVGAILTVLAVLLFLDTFGGYFLDGPLGPIPGGAFSGPVETSAPDWTRIEPVIEIEIRPARPWSLSVWALEHEGMLYVPSGAGARRRWPPVALADPRVRVRTQGKVYEQKIERIEDPEIRGAVLPKLAAKYDMPGDPSGEDDGSVWLFRISPR